MWAYFWKLIFGSSETATPVSSSQTDPSPSPPKLQNQQIHESPPTAAPDLVVPPEPTDAESLKSFKPEMELARSDSRASKVHLEKREMAEKRPSDDWEEWLLETEVLRKQGDLQTAETRFEQALSDGGDPKLFCEGLFKIWRLHNKEDLKKSNYEVVFKRVQYMLELYREGVKITDARALLKSAQALEHAEGIAAAKKAIHMIESQR